MSAPQFERRRHTHYYADARTDLERLNEPTSQLTIFDGRARLAPCLGIPLPSEPVDTSEAAAVVMQPHALSIRDAIVQYIAAMGVTGATAGEVSRAINLNPSTVRPRLREAEGTAPWCRGQLPVRIVKTATRRNNMRVYVLA